MADENLTSYWRADGRSRGERDPPAAVAAPQTDERLLAAHEALERFERVRRGVAGGAARSGERSDAMKTPRTTAIMALAALGLCTAEARAQVHLETPLLNPDRVKLSLIGEVGANYAVEGSGDLAHWYTVYSGVAENGRLEFETPFPEAASMFYRGRLDESGGIGVTPAVLTNRTTRTFVMTGQSSTRLLASRGTELQEQSLR